MSRSWWIPVVVVVAGGCGAPVGTLPVNGTAVLRDAADRPSGPLNGGRGRG
jgi:hypothetical protein